MIEVLRSRSRVFAFGIISVVYILAAAAGYAVYRAVPGVWQVRLLIADAAATVIVFCSAYFSAMHLFTILTGACSRR